MMSKYNVIYNKYTDNLLNDVYDYLIETEKDITEIDTLDLCHFFGKIEYLEKENQLLKEELINLKNDITRVYNTMISLETINKEELEEIEEI